jgi:DNA replication protein DnaC
MTSTDAIDAGRLTLALNDLRLPAIKTIWPDFAARADKEGWPAARFLAALAEHEMAERASRASSATSTRRGFHPARPSTASTSRRCR